jgi:hypothetical protein
MSKIKNITGLRDDLLEVYSKARTGKIDYKELNAVVNTAGKIINSARVQIKYQSHRNANKEIKFLED